MYLSYNLSVTTRTTFNRPSLFTIYTSCTVIYFIQNTLNPLLPLLLCFTLNTYVDILRNM